MTEDRLPLTELLRKAGDGDFLRSVAEAVLQISDGDGRGSADRRRPAQAPGGPAELRNGDRERTLDSRLGQLQRRVPKPRQGSDFPPFLEPRKMSEKALVAVIQEAWIGGVSTRRVDGLVRAPRRPPARRFSGHGSMALPSMGLPGISKSTVSRLCKDIDERVGAFLDRPPGG